MAVTFSAVNDSKVSSPTLAESAAAMQARLNRAPLKEVEVKTGEEGESNVFQVSIGSLNSKLILKIAIYIRIVLIV